MNSFKGWIGEKKTAIKMWFFLRTKSYWKFHNVILPSQYGTTQIDHLVISKYGLFIVETKNKKGWIFGSEKEKYWTQSIYGKSYSFQNPLRQTFRQKKILSEFLNIDTSKIHDVIYFVGDCKFRTQLPDNVIKKGLSRFIQRYKVPILNSEEVRQVIHKIEKQVTESSITNKDQIRSTKKRLASKTICPRCGSKLVIRMTKKGNNAGSKFLGCEQFPRCRFTKDM